MMRRLLPFLAILPIVSAMLLCAPPACSDDYSFYDYEVKEDGTAVITAYTGFDIDLRIPSELDGYRVSEIGKSAFFRNEMVRTLTIPDGIRVIGTDAFAGCENLRKIRIGEGTEVIGESAFEGCPKLVNLSLPESLNEIYDYAFRNCIVLGGVHFPASLESIGYLSFSGCTSLIMYCDDSPVAAEYARENSISTRFTQSSAFTWIMSAAGVSVLVAAAFVAKHYIIKAKSGKPQRRKI